MNPQLIENPAVRRLGRSALLSIAGLAVLAVGCAAQTQPLTAEELEEEAQGIDKSLMCPVCPSETIDQSQVQLAGQMREIVREKLAAGESRDEILQFFVDRYGTAVLAEPPRSGFNLLVWIVPPLALMAGGLVLAMVLRSMRSSQGLNESESVHPDEPGLEPYLSAVDRDIRGLASAGGVETSSDSAGETEPQSSGGEGRPVG